MMRFLFSLRAQRVGPALVGVLLASGCGPRAVPVIGPVADPSLSARLLQAETGLAEPLRIVFGWQLNEAGVRVRGRGVARVEPPYKARLDLFLDNGETVMKAALVDGDLRIPPGAPDNILPPADLMWGVLGVFRPEGDTELVGGDRLESDGIRLRYRYDDGTELHYWVAQGRVRSVERVERGHVVERVVLGLGSESRYPSEATYRHMAEYRELKLTRESLEPSGPYPSAIWDPVILRGGR